MRKYQSYKQSGVEWIGEIPSHWDFIKTNILTDNLDGKRVPLNSEERGRMEGEYPYWGSNGVVDYVNQFLFNEEIVLVGEDGSPFFDKLKDVSFYINEPVWVNNHIHILKPKERILPKYLTHSFNCVDYKEYITGSTRDKLTQSDLKRISHCVPPLSEQYQIVQFLDEKTELIDRLISINERKITLLKEQRTSLINQVVTRGLNPNVKMKDSGVEWIGEIPEDWIISKIKHNVGIRTGYSFKSDEFVDNSFQNDKVPVIRISNIQDGFIDLDGSVYLPLSYTERFQDFTLFKGDILICLTGSLTGKVGIFEHDLGLLNQRVGKFYFKNENKVLKKYFSYFIKQELVQKLIKQMGEGISENFPNVSHLDVIELNFPIPSFEEQNQIVEFLDFKTKQIDDLVSLVQKKIDLLKEYRQSLISEVVTGKIKVTTDE